MREQPTYIVVHGELLIAAIIGLRKVRKVWRVVGGDCDVGQTALDSVIPEIEELRIRAGVVHWNLEEILSTLALTFAGKALAVPLENCRFLLSTQSRMSSSCLCPDRAASQRDTDTQAGTHCQT